MSYKKTVKGENISADEIAAHNHIQVFNDGSGKLIVCFLMLLCLALIVYLWIFIHVLLVLIIVGTTILLCVSGGSAVFRHVSNTRRQHLVNEAEIEWSRLIYRTENLIATLNRTTREITVHNAQEVSIQHHHAAPQIAQITEGAQAKQNLMPKLSDLDQE